MQRWRACATLVAVMFFAGPVGAQETQVYGYDVHGQLSSFHRDTASASTVTAYGLDSADNQAARTMRAAVWEAEPLNRYTRYSHFMTDLAQIGHVMTFQGGIFSVPHVRFSKVGYR